MLFEPYPFSKVAGNLKTLQYLIKFHDKDVVEPVVVVPFDTGLIESLKDRYGVKCVVIEAPEQLNQFGGYLLKHGLITKLKAILAIISYAFRIRSFLRDNHFDAVYCNSVRSVLMAGLAARSIGIPFLWFVKGKLENPLYDLVAYFFSNRIVFYSEVNSQDRYPLLRRLLRAKVSIIRTGIDFEEVNEALLEDHPCSQSRLDIAESQFNIAYVGQLYPPKGVHILLAAMLKTKAAIPGLHVYIIGDPITTAYADYLQELQKFVETNRMKDWVTFTGWRRDAMWIMSRMDVVVHPSLAEGFSRTVLEAMALGKPVIATEVGGERETIKEGCNGYLVRPNDAAGIKAKTIKLYRDDELRSRIGSAAQETILKNHLIVEKVKAFWGTVMRMSKQPENHLGTLPSCSRPR